jgi:hypothetical protein
VSGVERQPTIGSQVSDVQTLPSSQFGGVPDVQTPVWQVSAPLQSVASAHELPLGSVTLPQPSTGSQLSVVQALSSSQSSGVPPPQIPFVHVSAPLQTLPSAQDVPLARFPCWQPRAGAQLSVVQGLPSLQSSGDPPAQTPAWQSSFPLQRFASPHPLPFATEVKTQPLAGWQVSLVQTFPSLQTSGAGTVQTPAWQVSAPLQASPSAHEVPFATVGFWQLPPLHRSVVQGLLSLHCAFTLHVWQPGTGELVHPVTTLHPSMVQVSPSLQSRGGPAVQLPV